MVRKLFFGGIFIAGCSFFLPAQQQIERKWEPHPLPNNASADIMGIAFDRHGAMWIAVRGVNTGGYKYVEPNDWTLFDSEGHHHPDTVESDENEIGCDENRCVAVDYKDNVWFGSIGHGISKLSDTTWRHITTISGIPNNAIRQILTVKDTIWVATKGGLCKIVGDSIKKYPIASGDNRDTNITCLTFDLSGNLWVGTDRGAFKFDGTSWSSRHRPVNSPLMTDNYIDALTVDSKGNIWAAVYEQGIYKYDGKDWKLQFNKKIEFTCLTFDKKGYLWAGTAQQGVWEFNGTYWTNYIRELLFNNYVHSIVANKDVVWIGCRGGLTKVYEDTTPLTKLADIEGNNSVFVYPNPAKNQFTISNVEDATIFLYTVSGQKIGTYYSLNENISIDVTPLEQGIYIVKIEKNNKIIRTVKMGVVR